ncbi:MAG: restriction endonuclease [bacterium]|nr:restriction endonuclease [bacterium]MDZ4205837.1 restriction endonuclease [Patescibacteria group bacterium]
MAQTTEQITVLKASGKRETFELEKLSASLLHSGATEEAVKKVLSHILPELRDGMTTNDIYEHAFSILQGISKPVARSYSLRRAVMDLGPSGFPFEDFVAEVLKAKGFKCETRQTVLGGCVPHEVDVVAYNDKKLIMVEAKFHNELGTKSDLKVVLYIKARFDDLRENVFNYGGTNRHITDCWLITNTKFSSTAIHYGVCKNLTMIGWNYPEKGGLQDMIEDEALHPITCLVSLLATDKKTLLGEKIVLCSDIKKNPKLLNEFLGRSFDIKPVIDEINELKGKR